MGGNPLAVIAAHFVFYSRIPVIIRERIAFKKNPGFKYDTNGMYDGNIVWEHFLRNKTRFTQLQRGFYSE